jgi:hypothetical protein
MTGGSCAPRRCSDERPAVNAFGAVVVRNVTLGPTPVLFTAARRISLAESLNLEASQVESSDAVITL